MDINNMDGMSMTSGSLSSMGLDLSNDTIAMDFLMALLDDSAFQTLDIAVSQAFWYGIVIVVGIACLVNILCKLKYRAR